MIEKKLKRTGMGEMNFTKRVTSYEIRDIRHE